MTVKTNNVQKGGRKPILSILGIRNETSAEQIIRYIYGNNTYKIREEFPCFPTLSEVTHMNGKFPIKEGNDLKNDIQIGINYAVCQKCEGDDCQCYNKGNFCHRNQLCEDDESATKYVRDKYKCFLNNKNLSFDDYYLACYFKMYSKIITDYSKRYIEKSDYDYFHKAVSWKFPTLKPKHEFMTLGDNFISIIKDNPKYLSWEELYKHINRKRGYGGKKSRKSRNKKRKSNKKKRKTVKKRKG